MRDLLVSLAPERLQPRRRAPRPRRGRCRRRADALRRRPRRVGRRRRLRRRGVLGRVRRRAADRRAVRRDRAPRRCARSAAASRSGSPSRPCCAATTTSCCSTSPTTSSTSPASAGWRASCERRARRSCSSATTASCSPRPRRKIVTVEANGAWTHGGGFAGYHEARQAHLERREHDRALYDDERQRLEELVAEMRRRAKISDGVRPKPEGRREPAAPVPRSATSGRELVREQKIDVRLGGARTGKRAVIIEQLELDGLTDPFDLERRSASASPCSGRTAPARATSCACSPATRPSPTTAACRLGAGVVPGPLPPDPRAPRVGRAHAARDPPRPRRRARPGDGDAAPLRAAGLRRAAVRDAVGRPAGPLPDPPARAVRRHAAAARRADRQPRPRVGRGARDRARRVHRAPSSPSPTTAGSCAASTASSCSTTTARSPTTSTGPPRGDSQVVATTASSPVDGRSPSGRPVK